MVEIFIDTVDVDEEDYGQIFTVNRFRDQDSLTLDDYVSTAFKNKKNFRFIGPIDRDELEDLYDIEDPFIY